MQRIVEFTDGNGMYAVPENDVKNFLAEDPKATRVRRFVGKDGSSYAVPENDVKDFLAEDSDVEEVFPIRTADGKEHFIPQSASKGRITKYNRGAFANDDAMGGMRLGALEAQAEGGVDAAEDDGSIGSWFKNLWNTFSHAAGGKMVSSDMEAKTHQVMNDAYKGKDGKDRSFEDLPDSVLDEYMNTIAPNGYWSYLGNAIGLGGKNRLMAEWDRDVGSKIEDPTERKKARVAYAREFAQIGFENTERRKDRARAEIEGREKAFGAGAVAGATQIAGYALPMAAPGGVGIALSAGIEGATRRNELLQDRHETTDSGEIIRTAKGDTRNAALGKGAVGGAATALIEKYGGKLAGKALGKVAGKIPGVDKIAETKAGKFLSRTGKFIDRYFGWTGQQSAPEEYAEEFMQGLVDAAFGLDMRESEKEGTTALGRMVDFTGEFFAPKNLADLGESMFLVQLLGGTVGHLKNRSDSKRADRVLQNLGYDISAAKDFTADEKWRAIDAHYRGMSSDQVNEIFDKGAKAMDGLIKQFESENLATADGRAHIAAMRPEAVKKIVEVRKEGKDVSRKMIRDAGLSEDVWKDVAARNDLGDSFIADRKRTEEIERAKMDGFQANALAETISEFFGDSPEAQKVFDRIVSKLKDASVLDDPAVRENLVMEEGEKFWAEGREERIKAARERAKAAEKADHEARLAEAERAKEARSVRAERDAQERTNAEMLAREERRFRKGQKAEQDKYDAEILAREESYTKKVETRKTLNAEHDRIRRKMESGENLSLAEKQFMEQYAEVERMKASQTEGRLPAHIGAEATTAEAPAQTEESRRELKDGYEMRPVEGSTGNVAYRVYDKNGKWVGNVRKDGSRAVAVNKLRTKGVEEGEYAPWEKGTSAETEITNTEEKNETRTDETQPKSEQAAQPGARKGKAARSVEAAETPAEVGGAVDAAQKPSTSAFTKAKINAPTQSAEGVEGGSRAAGAKTTKNDTPVIRQTHDEAVENVVVKAKADGHNLDELGELRPPTPKVVSKPGRVSPLKKVDEKSVVNALKNIASLDKVRGYLHRVHVENGDMVATDGRVLLFGKAPKGMKDGEYATTPIGEKRIDDRYPLWKQIVPDAKRSGYKEVGIISNGDTSTDSVAFAGRLNKRFHKEQRKDSPHADVRIGEQLVSPELLKNLTDAMFRLGVKDITVYQGKAINSPLLLKGRNADGEITGVIMPLRLNEGADSAKKTHVRLFGKATEASANKKIARIDEKTVKSAETAKQTPETAAKKPFEEKYREWAEEDVPAWAKDLSPEEKAEYERLLDDVLSPKEGKSDIERGEKSADAYNALMEFEKAHTPKRGRGRPKKKDVGAKADTPEALADNYAKFIQQRIDRFNSAKTSADFDKVKDFADGELEAQKAVKSNPEAVKKFNEKYGKLFAEQNRVVHEATEKWRQVKEVEDAKAEEDAKALRASPEGFAQLEKDVNRIFGKFRVNAGSVSKTEEVVSVSDLIKRGYKVEKAKRGAAYNYRLTDGNGWYKIGKKELRLDGEEYNKAIADLIEYSERVAKGEKVAEPVAPKAEEEAPKSAKPDVDEVKKAMRALGALGGADISALEKALKEAEGGGLKERAKFIKTLLDYKKNLPKYGDARTDVTSGGRYRASIETAKPLDDPDFKAWAKKRGVVPTQQKREQYDKERVNAATKALSRWIKGVKVNFVNAISEADLNGETRAAIKQEEYDAWNKILDDYENKSFDSTKNYPVFSRMPAVLRRIGVNDLPITMRGGILQKITGEIETSKGEYHGIPVSELRKLQIELDNPIAVFDSASRDDSIVVLTRLVDNQNNERAVVALRLDQAGSGRVRINAITSAYGKGRGSFDGWIKDKKLLRYVNKEARNKSARWLQLPGDSKFRALNILTEKDFSDEELGRIIPKSDADSNDIRYLHDGERIVGTYNRKTGEVTLAKGADIGTVVHELGWHAARHWAETTAAKGNRRAIALLATMRRYAEEAPPEIKDAVLATYGEIDADALLDEIGAARFTAEKSPTIAKAIDSRAGAAWYKRIWNTVVDFVKDYLVSQNGNRVDLTGVENMSPQRFANFFATAMLSGKTLGENRNTMALEKSLLDAWTSKLSDYLDPVRKLSRRFYGTDGEAYRMGRIRKGTAQQGRNKAERAMKRVDKILVKNEISPGLLDQYMQAMAYEERNAKIEKRNRKKDGSGMTQETADAIFEEIDERGIRDKIQEAAQILWDLQDEGLQKRVNAGLISQETADRWRKEEPHHVPWRDVIDPESNEWMGRDYSKADFITAEGRTTSASGSPTTLMLQEFVNAFERAAENQFRQEIADMARMNDVIGTIYDAVQTDKQGNRSFIKYPQGGERAKVMSIPDGAKLESTSKGDGGLDNVLVFRENGETKYLVLNGDLGKAVAGAATGRTVAKANKVVSALMRGYSATATALSPTFAVRNFSADNLDVSGNLIKDYGYLVGGRLIKKTLVNEAKMAKDLLKYSYSGTFDGTSKEFQDLVDRFETAGGLIGGATTEGYDEMQKRIAADFRAGRNRARTIGRNIVTGWLALQKASELTTRLAVFKALTENGLSDKEAAMWSRESTVDFNKKGNWTPITNVLWMFSNSALGSSTRQLKGLFTTKNGIKFASGIAALGIAEGVLECAMNPEDDDDEGLGSGADMTEYERQNHFYIRFGNHVFKTKFHMGPFGYLKYLGNVAGRVMCGKMTVEKAAKELGSTALEVGAAFTGIGNVSMDAVAETSVPTILQPIVQGLTGVDYAGRPIYKKKFNEAKPDSSHGRSSTPGVYHWLAKKVNSLTGGGDYEKGGIDLTPETLKHITEAVGKNFVRDVVNIAGLGWNALALNFDYFSETRNIPFARDVHRKIDGNENRYYEALRRFEEDKYMLKDPNFKGEDRKKFFREHPWLRTNGAIGGTVVGSLKKKIDEWRRLEEKEGVSEEAKAKYKAFRRKAQARVIELMTPLEK